MAYFLIGLDSERVDSFRERVAFLQTAVCLSKLAELDDYLPSTVLGDVFFLFVLDGGLTDLDDFALQVKRTRVGKLVYVTGETSPAALKEHQFSAAGGDVYVMENVEPEMLKDILTGLVGEQAQSVVAAGPGPKVEAAPEQDASEELPPELDDLALDDEPADEQNDHQGGNLGSANKKADDAELSLEEGDLDEGFDLSLDDSPEDLVDLSGDAPDLPEDELALADEGDESFDLDLSEDSMDLSSESDDLDLDDEEAAPLDMDSDEGLDLELGGEDDFSLGAEDDDASLELSDDNVDLELGDDDAGESLDFSSDDDLSLELGGEESALELGDDAPAMDLGEADADLDLGGDMELGLESSSGQDLSSDSVDDIELGFGAEEEQVKSEDLSEEAMAKLAEIDAIMETDATQAGMSRPLEGLGEDLEESLVGDDLNLDGISFGAEEEVPVQESKPKKSKKKEAKENTAADYELGKELKELSGAWNGEMERTQATLANLRADREELLARIQEMEEEKIYHNRQMLSMRAELDERKIELSIMRKKLNEEINELKDRLKLHDERRLILEEKNRILMQELDKTAQRNKLDVKKVQMRERELEQKLELLKADAETQIRNRDLKILELKRKIDAMEFDMESISQQEKRSVESRFELEDKLDKAIKTLRSAISVLEDESERGNALDALKKNIDI